MKIKNINKEIRNKLFYVSKCRINKQWKNIASDLNISKSSLERYKSGQILIPERIFNYFIRQLKKSEKEEILENILKFENNFGQVLGGKNAYKKNHLIFQEGRKKGIKSLKKNNWEKNKISCEHVHNISITPQISEVIGAFIGDGFFNCYNNKLYHVGFSGDQRLDYDYYINIINPILKEIFPKTNPGIHKRKKGYAMQVNFYSKEFFVFLKDVFGFIPGRKTHTIFIPALILENKEFTYATIRGIFNTDGCVFLDKRKNYAKPYPRISLQTVSKPLYDQLKNILSKEFKLYSNFYSNRNVYVIEIYGYSNLKKWISLIGFSNKRHLDKIASVA